MSTEGAHSKLLPQLFVTPKKRRHAGKIERNTFSTSKVLCLRNPRYKTSDAQNSCAGMEKNMKVIIVGGGQVGSYLASLLIPNGHDITVIEHREKYYNKLLEEFPAEVLIYGNGSDPVVLEQAGIKKADVVAAVSGADEINLVVSTLAKMEFGVPRVVARVNNPRNAWLYNSGMGVDVGVNQADLMAHFVVEEMDLEDMFTLMKLSRGDYSIVQMKVGHTAKAANKLVRNLSIPKKTVLIAITRDENLIIPKGDCEILVGDEILALTDEASRLELKEIFG